MHEQNFNVLASLCSFAGWIDNRESSVQFGNRFTRRSSTMYEKAPFC